MIKRLLPYIIYQGKEWGGTGIYKYKPTNTIKITAENQNIVHDMIKNVQQHESTHQGYLDESTELLKRLLI